MVGAGRGLYLSYEADVSLTQQGYKKVAADAQLKNASLAERADPRFFFNRQLAKHLTGRSNLSACCSFEGLEACHVSVVEVQGAVSVCSGQIAMWKHKLYICLAAHLAPFQRPSKQTVVDYTRTCLYASVILPYFI